MNSTASSIETILDRAPMNTDVSAPIVAAARRAGRAALGREVETVGMPYFTDASVIGPAANFPIILVGPGDPGQAHQTDEFITLASVLAAERFYTELVAQHFAAEGAV